MLSLVRRPRPSSRRSRDRSRGRVRGRVLTVAIVCAAVVTACGDPDAGVTANRADDAGGIAVDPTSAPPESVVVVDPTNPATPTTVVPLPENNDPPPNGGIVDFGSGKTPREYDNFVDRAFVDITTFWEEQYPLLYSEPFEPIDHIYAIYPARSDPAQCSGDVPYEYVELNAKFVDCGDGTDVIMYDDEQLIPQLVEQFGVVSVAVVAAHEYGHAISSHAGVFEIPGLRTIDLEQQADCFAGAWVGRVIRGESDLLSFTDDDVKASIAAMIFIRDPVGLDSANDQSGHGSAFDRVGAFQDGFVEGAARCAEYPTRPNPRVDLFFVEGTEEAALEGNLPFDQITEALPKALDTFWVPTLQAAGVTFTSPTMVSFPHAGPFPDCDGRTPEQMLSDPATFCTGTNTVAFDADYVRALYDTYGDLAYGYPIAQAYSDAVQTALQFPMEGEDRVLVNDCLVGAWIRDIIPAGFDADGAPVATNPEQEILLSAGDLDEVVSTAVLEGDVASTTNIRGTAFEKIDAFRSGVQDAFAGCQALIDELVKAQTG
jgi:predicted metalloprotease